MKYSLLPIINAFKRQNSCTDPFRKSSTSFTLIFPKLSSQNMHGGLNMLSVTSRFVSPVSTVSAKNRIMSPLLASTHEKKKKERNTCNFSLAAKQARLIPRTAELITTSLKPFSDVFIGIRKVDSKVPSCLAPWYLLLVLFQTRKSNISI